MNEDRAVFEALLAAQSTGNVVALATVIQVQGSVPRHVGSKMLVRIDASIVGTVGGGRMESLAVEESLVAMRDGKARTITYSLNDLLAGDPGICGGSVQIFIEPIGMVPLLLVIGGGHVGKALAELGKWCGYRVALADDRPEYCNSAYAPDLDAYIVSKPGEIVEHIEITPQTYVACVTRGLPVDLDLLPALIHSPAPYLGLIGSRRRWALTVKALKEQRGMTDDLLKRVYAPIGLELNAETPHEIAISILAQITQLRRGGNGLSMQWMGDVEASTTA